MAKKGSSTTPSRKAKNKKEESVPEQKNSASKVAGNEIDEIFAGKKRKKPDPKGSEKPNGDEISKPKSSKKKSKKSRETNREGGFNESSSGPWKRTADGFAIYTEEELGISKSDAGNCGYLSRRKLVQLHLLLLVYILIIPSPEFCFHACCLWIPRCRVYFTPRLGFLHLKNLTG